MKAVFGLSIMLFFCSVQAAGSIDFLEVENGIVTFSTTETKAAASPSCVVPDNAKIWTLSLSSESDRANYTMLVTALSTHIKINVESANDCAYQQGVERANRVWFASESSE